MIVYSNYGLPEQPEQPTHRRMMGLEWSQRSPRNGIQNWRLRSDKKSVARCRRLPDGAVSVELYREHGTERVVRASNVEEAKRICYAWAEELRDER
jgi:hypothetical protein